MSQFHGSAMWDAIPADLLSKAATAVPGLNSVSQVDPIADISTVKWMYQTDFLTPAERIREWGPDYFLCLKRRRGVQILEKDNERRLQSDVQTLADRYISRTT